MLDEFLDAHNVCFVHSLNLLFYCYNLGMNIFLGEKKLFLDMLDLTTLSIRKTVTVERVKSGFQQRNRELFFNYVVSNIVGPVITCE